MAHNEHDAHVALADAQHLQAVMLAYIADRGEAAFDRATLSELEVYDRKLRAERSALKLPS
jgi:hypothetical protein